MIRDTSFPRWRAQSRTEVVPGRGREDWKWNREGVLRGRKSRKWQRISRRVPRSRMERKNTFMLTLAKRKDRRHGF